MQAFLDTLFSIVTPCWDSYKPQKKNYNMEPGAEYPSQKKLNLFNCGCRVFSIMGLGLIRGFRVTMVRLPYASKDLIVRALDPLRTQE